MRIPTAFFLALAANLLTASAAFAQAANEPRVVLKGYDPVAYFTEQRPVKGAPELRQDWDGARYYFASARNRAAFNADPDRYTPQFGSFCAASMEKGKRIEADPTIWKIVDGKLYVFGALKGREIAEKDPGILARSREAWQRSR